MPYAAPTALRARGTRWSGEPVSVAAVTAALALLASLLWGVADFLGGLASRRLPAVSVVGVSQLVAAVLLVVIAAASRAFGDDIAYLGWATAAGTVGLVGLACFYSALASGTMGVVAPVASLGVVVPVAVGLVRGEAPTGWQVAGIGIATLGVVLAGGPEVRATRSAGSRPLLLAAVAAVSFGTVLVLIERASQHSVVMTLLTMRVTVVVLLVTAALALRRRVGVRRGDLPLIAAIGIGDALANGAFALASRSGLVSVTGALASLYPAVTVLLARQVLRERLAPIQTAGVLATLAGALLLAAG